MAINPGVIHVESSDSFEQQKATIKIIFPNESQVPVKMLWRKKELE